MFRLLIVDDEYYVRVGIKSAIYWSEIGVEVVGEAAEKRHWKWPFLPDRILS